MAVRYRVKIREVFLDSLQGQTPTVMKKPLEIYMFIDPLCPECWALEPILKKLHIEYGRYFSIKHVLSGRIANLRRASR